MGAHQGECTCKTRLALGGVRIPPYPHILCVVVPVVHVLEVGPLPHAGVAQHAEDPEERVEGVCGGGRGGKNLVMGAEGNQRLHVPHLSHWSHWNAFPCVLHSCPLNRGCSMQSSAKMQPVALHGQAAAHQSGWAWCDENDGEHSGRANRIPDVRCLKTDPP